MTYDDTDWSDTDLTLLMFPPEKREAIRHVAGFFEFLHETFGDNTRFVLEAIIAMCESTERHGYERGLKEGSNAA